MGDMRLFAVIVLLVGVAESRSVQLDLLSLIKNVALNGGGAETNDASLHSNVGGETAEGGYGQDNKVGFILFGNLEDLEKYQIELSNKVDNDKVSSGHKLNVVNMVKENIEDLAQNSEILEVTEDEDDKKEISDDQVEEVVKEKRGNFFFKYLDDFKEDEDSEDYDILEGKDGRENKVDIFSEDEYNEYEEKDEAAEEVSNEEDESEEERFYDEDEKYYEDEENRFKYNEEESPNDGIFM